jgi:hypothetical protein
MRWKMNELRKAAEMALKYFEILDNRGGLGLDVHEYIRTKIEALRQALEQPENLQSLFAFLGKHLGVMKLHPGMTQMGYLSTPHHPYPIITKVGKRGLRQQHVNMSLWRG